MSRSPIAAAAATLLLAAAAWAQETTLDPIVVTGSWEPAPAEDQAARVVPVDWPAQAAVPGPADSLREVPGVEVRAAGGTGAISVSIRGAEFGQVLGLYRGLPLNSPLAGGLDFGALPVLPAEGATAEVLAGTASGVYGTDAVGGVVNIVSSPIDPDGGLVVGIQGGTLGTASVSLLGSGRGGNEVLWRAGAGFFAADGDRDNSASTSGIVVGSATAALPCDRTLALDLRHLSRTSELPGPQAYPSPNATQRDAKTWLAIAADPAGGRGFSAALLGRIETVHYTDPDFGADSTHRFTDLTGRARWTGPLGEEGTVTAGAEGSLLDASSTDSGDHAEERGALFGHAVGRVGGPVRMTGSLRLDVADGGVAELSPQVAFLLDLPSGLTGALSVARAFRAPTLNERYWVGAGGAGNPDLSAEHATEFAASLRWRHPRAALAATAFRREVDDLITWKDDDGDWTWVPVNVASASITGVEADVAFTPCARVSLRGGWSWLSPVDDATGDPIAGRPRHTVTAALALAPTPATSVDLSARLSDHHRDTDGTRRSFVVLDASAARDVLLFGRPARLSLTLENLLNEGYQEVPGYPMPGRRVAAAMEVFL